MDPNRDGQPAATGAHPTTRDFVERLTGWGFTRLREDGVHAVYRAPRGGRVRVIRSLQGRADPALVDKAARLAGVSVEEFLAGPQRTAKAGAEPTQPTRPAAPPRHRRADHDRITSTVLGIHAAYDRPLSFDQVVDYAGGRVTRQQVSAASSLLCRQQDLRRIRSGVYQWAGGVLAFAPVSPGLYLVPTELAAPVEPVEPAAAVEPAPNQETLAAVTASQIRADLFERYFPAGIRTTADVLADLDRWSELTAKLVTYANAS
jgi:hypothetical protein